MRLSKPPQVVVVQLGIREGTNNLLPKKVDVGLCLLNGNAGSQASEDEVGLVEVVLVTIPVRGHSLHHRHRHPYIRRMTNHDAKEARRSNANDVEGGVAELDGVAEHVGIAGKCALPP